jgi:predicted nucleotidyltransferase component of viral defense system
MALSRFYLHHRYSDDLDFFDHDLALFPDAFRLVYRKLVERWPEVSVEVDARGFKRIYIRHEKTPLKLDFVADRVSRIGLPVVRDGMYIDTVRNILSNKLSAILGRDEGRDIADMLYISMSYRFSWKTILAELAQKEGFKIEDLLFRLETFPVEILETIPFISRKPPKEYADALSLVVHDIGVQADNSLAEQLAPDL